MILPLHGIPANQQIICTLDFKSILVRMKLTVKFCLLIIGLTVIGCFDDDPEQETQEVSVDTVDYYEVETTIGEEVLGIATEKVTDKVMEILTPEQHIRALKYKIKAAKKINDFDKREKNIMIVILAAIEVKEYKLAHNWVGDLKDDDHKDAMLEKINTSIEVVRDSTITN